MTDRIKGDQYSVDFCNPEGIHGSSTLASAQEDGKKGQEHVARLVLRFSRGLHPSVGVQPTWALWH